jgi:SAM-dependent methyltransferase
MFELRPEMLEGLPVSGPTDPIEYYRRPLIGPIYIARINRGLGLLPPDQLGCVLEVGYGAGAVLRALAPGASELHGIDLDVEPATVAPSLLRLGVHARLHKGSVLELPYDSQAFDLVVSFSVFEHIHDYDKALSEVVRVLRPHGHFLLGMPAVNRGMELAFRALGFKGIEDHHVTRPQNVARAFGRARLQIVRAAHLDLPARRPLGLRVYNNWLLRVTD